MAVNSVTLTIDLIPLVAVVAATHTDNVTHWDEIVPERWGWYPVKEERRGG